MWQGKPNPNSGAELTLLALSMALAFKVEGREVFVVGEDESGKTRITGLDLEKTGFREVDALSSWHDLPNGAVIVADECWRDIPARAPGKQGPEWEQELAVHRHRGFGCILIYQQGSQISAFVRGLVHKYTHVRRKFGFAVSRLNTWGPLLRIAHVGWRDKERAGSEFSVSEKNLRSV